jgi:hypothetical protein
MVFAYAAGSILPARQARLLYTICLSLAAYRLLAVIMIKALDYVRFTP